MISAGKCVGNFLTASCFVVYNVYASLKDGAMQVLCNFVVSSERIRIM